MSYQFNCPELPLEPPESARQEVFCCKMCGASILEGDEYWDFEFLGVICENCVEEAHRSCAEL